MNGRAIPVVESSVARTNRSASFRFVPPNSGTLRKFPARALAVVSEKIVMSSRGGVSEP